MLCTINEVLLLNYKHDLKNYDETTKDSLERRGVSIVQLCLLTTMLPAALSPSLKLPHCFNTQVSLYKKMIRPQTYLTEITSPSDLVVSSHSISCSLCLITVPILGHFGYKLAISHCSASMNLPCLNY